MTSQLSQSLGLWWRGDTFHNGRKLSFVSPQRHRGKDFSLYETTTAAYIDRHVSMAHPFLDYARDHNKDSFPGEDAIKRGISRVSMIKTPGRFSFMEIPAELRVKIYDLLLRSEDAIEIPLSPSSSLTESAFKPCVALLKTCKMVDEEASPILYSKNKFTISLGISSNLATLLSKIRWSTLRSITSIKFISTGPFHRPNPLTGNTLPAPYFECSGNDILARFREGDLKDSPQGPDQYMGLHVATWISTAVTKAELTALQRDLELMADEGDEEQLT